MIGLKATSWSLRLPKLAEPFSGTTRALPQPLGPLGRRLVHQDRQQRVREQRRQRRLLPSLSPARALVQHPARPQLRHRRARHLVGSYFVGHVAALPARGARFRRPHRLPQRPVHLDLPDRLLLAGRLLGVALPDALDRLHHVGARGALEARRRGRAAGRPDPQRRLHAPRPDDGLLPRAARLEAAPCSTRRAPRC